MRKILIIGATSAIAKECAKIWNKSGNELFLVARNKEHLVSFCTELKGKKRNNVTNLVLDLNNISEHDSMLKQALSRLAHIDIVLICYGTLPDQKKCEVNVEYTLSELKNNAISVVALISLIANYFERRKKGTLVVMSSIAGERGRASNYVYGSAKAMVTSFLSGLSQRLNKSNVSVITVKPGFVDTPMTNRFY